MEKSDKKRISDTLNERCEIIRVGILRIKVRPLTLGQIYEIGAAACDINAKDLQYKDKVRVVAEMIAHYNDAKAMQEIFLICAYRNRWLRKLFRRYILHRLTVKKFQDLISIISKSFDANFFLTSIIFLSQTKQVTEPN